MFIVFTKDGDDITKGKVYELKGAGPDLHVIDDVGVRNYSPSPNNGTLRKDYVVLDIDRMPEKPYVLKDIHGQSIYKGDYVAYAYSTGTLAVFQVMSITGEFGLCRHTVNNFTTTLGVFEERALKLKDYNK